MATSRISTNTTLTSSKDERRQVEARIRALQQRTNTLYEELSRSSSVANTAVQDIEQAYMTIISEFQDQRDQLLRRIHHAKQNIRQSSNDLNGIRKHLDKTQTFHMPQSSPRYSSDFEVKEMNAMVDDIERALTNIAQKFKQYRFKPAHGHAINKTLGTIQTGKIQNRKELPVRSLIKQYNPSDYISIHKLYTIDIDISVDWIVASIEDRIFLCNNEGEVRIYSYSNRLRRQPLKTEQFHLSTIRLISSFTITRDYLVAFETDTQTLTLHSYHGALLVRIRFPYDPIMIVRCQDSRKNQIWSCSRSKRQCLQFNLHHTLKEINPIEQLDFKQPVSNISIDPVGISTDEQERIAVHDVNRNTSDRLLLFTDQRNMIVPLDFVKHGDRQISSRIERVLLVPKQSNLIVLVYAPQSASTNLHEIVVVDIEVQPAQVLYRLPEQYGIRNLDLTPNGELVFCVTPPANKRIIPKMQIYSLVN